MLYHLRARLGLSGDMLALVMVPALVLSGGLDVMLGHALRRISPRRILRMQAIGAVATGLGVVTLFAIGSGNVVALLLTMIVFRVAYTLYDVTQNALTSLLPSSEADARRYVTSRVMLSSAALPTVASAAMLLVGDVAPLAEWEAIVLLPATVLAIVSSLAMTMCRSRTLVGPIAANILIARLGRDRGFIAMTMLTIIGLAGLAMSAHPPVQSAGIAIHGIGVGGTGMLRQVPG